MDLEKEIEKYYYKHFAFLSSAHILTLDILAAIAKHFVEWQKNKTSKTIKLAEDHAMLAGMMKEREHMLKDAVDVRVETSVLGPPMVCCMAKGCNNGDKVKLIIIKEEEK